MFKCLIVCTHASVCIMDIPTYARGINEKFMHNLAYLGLFSICTELYLHEVCHVSIFFRERKKNSRLKFKNEVLIFSTKKVAFIEFI